MDKNNFSKQPDNIRIKFTKIKQIRNRIKSKFKLVTEIKESIKQSYIHYISRDQEDFFGLDSFHFQNKVLELEVQNMVRLYQYIDNRIYGDYYKLFGEIHGFMKKNLTPKQFASIKELEHFDKYPIYRDLEPFKTYDFDTINTIHQDIIIVISNVRHIHKDNERHIKEDMKKMLIGLNIDNYIINSQYKNTVLMTTNMKFENYLQVFHKYHFDLLEKFHEKLSLCHQHIEHNTNDERFARSPSISSTDDDEHSSDDSYNEHDASETQVMTPKGNMQMRKASFSYTTSNKNTAYDELELNETGRFVVEQNRGVSHDGEEDDEEDVNEYVIINNTSTKLELEYENENENENKEKDEVADDGEEYDMNDVIPECNDIKVDEYVEKSVVQDAEQDVGLHVEQEVEQYVVQDVEQDVEQVVEQDAEQYAEEYSENENDDDSNGNNISSVSPNETDNSIKKRKKRRKKAKK